MHIALSDKRKKCNGGLMLVAVYPPSTTSSQTTAERGQAGTKSWAKTCPKAEQTSDRAQCRQVQNCTEPPGLYVTQLPGAG